MPKIDKPKTILISRTDSIGDVVLTLPLAGILKKKFKGVKIIFLGNTYTRPIIECCEHVDEVYEWAVVQQYSYDRQLEWLLKLEVDVFIHVFPRKEIARLAKKANINYRIGTSHRIFHLLSCNIRVNFTRKKSDEHEAQLNTKLLAPLGIKKSYSLKELTTLAGFTRIKELPQNLKNLLNSDKKKVILHPKSQGSAIEWGVKNFMQLAEELDSDKFQVFITGTEKEAEQFRSDIPDKSNIIDLSGKMTLDELVSFIANVDYLVAASTGPLHIAGLCQKRAIGLFSDTRPIHPGRWKPLGDDVSILVSKNNLDNTQPLDIPLRDVKRMVEELL